jgi:predicted dehydrogenase
LEKPGAPTVTELESMRDEANAANVPVFMGYNKNVCKFVSRARTYAAENGGDITFVSNNTYENTPESLGECFERNAEGMLKNMAIHELALLVSFYDVTVENIAECVADKTFSSCQTLVGPSSGKEFTDFDKIKFTITTKSGKQVSVQADRCGGDTSYAKVELDGVEVFRHSMPDEDDQANVTVLEQEYPGAMVRFQLYIVMAFVVVCFERGTRTQNVYIHCFPCWQILVLPKRSRTFSVKIRIILQ